MNSFATIVAKGFDALEGFEPPSAAASASTPSGPFSLTENLRTCPFCDIELRFTSKEEFEDHKDQCRPANAPRTPPRDQPFQPKSPVSESSLSPAPESFGGFENIESCNDLKPTGTRNPEMQLNSTEIPEALNSAMEAAKTIRPYVEAKSKFVYYDDLEKEKIKAAAAAAKMSISEEPEGSNPDEPKISDEPQDAEELTLEATPTPTQTPTPAPATPTPSAAPIDDIKSNSLNLGLGLAKRYPFPEFTPIENYENYLNNPQDMAYEDLYQRTSFVSDTLLDLQDEWDEIDREIFYYEEYKKFQDREVADAAKLIQDEEQALEDIILVRLFRQHESVLALGRKEFARWAETFEAENPDVAEQVALINKLRDSTFLKAFRKRQGALAGIDPKHKSLINKPIPEYKPTKDELELEKRKRGRLTDAQTFDDANQADAYGFTYSAADLHRGNQPLPNYRAVAKGDPAIGKNGRALRSTRRTTKRTAYGTEPSQTPPSDEDTNGIKNDDDIPAKRTRAAPKKYAEDMGEDSRARPKTFASGKRIGRPPGSKTKNPGQNKPIGRSKLNNAMRVSSPTPSIPKDNSSDDSDGDDEDEVEVELEMEYQDARGGPDLMPEQEADLYEAAESVINRTISEKASKNRKRKAKVTKDETFEGSSAATPAELDLDEDAPPAKKPKRVPAKRVKKPKSEEIVKEEPSLESSPAEVRLDENAPATKKPKRAGTKRGRKHKGQSDVQEAPSGDPTIAGLEITTNTLPDNKRKRVFKPPKSEEVVQDDFSDDAAAVDPEIDEGVPPAKKPKRGGTKRGKKPKSEETVQERSSNDVTPLMQPQIYQGEDIYGASPQDTAPSHTQSNEGHQIEQPSIAISQAPKAAIKPRGGKKNSLKKGEFVHYTNNQTPNALGLNAIEQQTKRSKSTKKLKYEDVDQADEEGKTGTDNIGSPQKKKHAGGRPRKSNNPDGEAIVPPKQKRVIKLKLNNGDSAQDGKIAPPDEKPKVEGPTDTVVVDTTVAAVKKRIRKPTKRAMGLDGAVESEEDDTPMSEYDRWRALTSPGHRLGKRERKSKVDLAMLMQSDEDVDMEDSI